MKIVIVKYNAGNIHSVELALQRLGYSAQVTDDPQQIRQADKVIFPGVGEASSAMRYLEERNLSSLISGLKQPVLGICLGLQLMCSYSEENETQCFNIFPVKVKKFPAEDKVPHMGWNALYGLKGPLFEDIKQGSYVYFVHSYYAEQNNYQIAGTTYILPFCAAVQKDNFFAVQFHPEKSADVGELILKNFIEMKI